MQKKDWVTVDVMTMAAPDLRSKSNRYAPIVGDSVKMSDAALFAYHLKRAIHMLTVAASKGADILVLGAFGCGAFENDPHVVAKAYQTALQIFPKVFDHIEFAVHCSPKDQTNYEVFRDTFDNHSEAMMTKEENREENEDMEKMNQNENAASAALLQEEPVIIKETAKSSINIRKISITNVAVDAIVNAANDGLWAGGGVCGAIFRAAGAEDLTAACKKYNGCKTGNAVITPGFRLPAKYIIHAVGPVWHGGQQNEAKLLYSAYKQSLILAKENGCHSIAFPLISAGIFGYPKAEAWKKAIQACKDFLQANEGYDMQITFAVLDDEILAMGQDALKKFEK